MMIPFLDRVNELSRKQRDSSLADQEKSETDEASTRIPENDPRTTYNNYARCHCG